MGLLSIKDYLNLKNIYIFLTEKHHEMVSENNGFSSEPSNLIAHYCANLEKILNKLESEE